MASSVVEQEPGAEHPAEQRRSQTAAVGFMEAWQEDHEQRKDAGASQTLKDGAGNVGAKLNKLAQQAYEAVKSMA